MTPEAMFLHCIDLTDTRMHQVAKDLKEDRNNATAWTPTASSRGTGEEWKPLSQRRASP